jgi:phosphoribosyl 1,2-cyclic phosphate phosphodiesterase
MYAEARCMATIRTTFGYIFNGDYPFGGVGRLDPHLIEGPFDLWGLKLTPVPVLHGHLPVLGYRFRDTAYVTDVSEIPEPSLSLLGGLDILIIDALRPKPHPTHLSLSQALAMVERLKPRRAFFTHIAHDLGHQETNSALPPNVQLAYDGLKLDL